MIDSEVHRCARGQRCAHFEPSQASGQSLGATIEQPRGLCQGCADAVTKALAELPTDYVELHFLLGSGSSGITSDVVRSTRDLPVPIRLSVEGLQRSLVHEASHWAGEVAGELGITWRPHHTRPGALLQRSAQLLVNGFGTLVGLPEATYRHHNTGQWCYRDGLEGALELFRLHGLVRFAAGRTKLVHKLPAPCPRCETMSLVRHNGDDLVICEYCPPSEDARWTPEDYKRLCLILAQDYRAEVA